MPEFTKDTTANEVAAYCSSAIEGKVVLVTGISPKGLGAEFCLSIAKHAPSLIILAGRNAAKSQETSTAIHDVAPSVQTRFLELDLTSQAQIREAAKVVMKYADVSHIDILLNNAGVMAGLYQKTVDGIEMQFASNHIGHFLFTNLIMEKLVSPDAEGMCRVVNVSSDGHRLSPVRFKDWNFDDGKAYQQWRAYGQSKTANMLFSIALSIKLRHKGLVSVSLHPGVISTNLGGGLLVEAWDELAATDHAQGNRKFADGFSWKTAQQGAATHVFASFHPSIPDNNGAYLEDCQVFSPAKVRCWGRDPVEAEKLWKLSEMLVGQSFEYC
ncbi:hypothetical protein N7495_007431 [Penicillium taxi]|uniref:uncharacterized protein n=1 Tax=Penicillium taxi TaxID=168475 RepID=UPI0025452409|nr:uncharacterized protein N7495_007431 [Penicillium taxi]KAJ5887390.1 hypothetical protein N7495_007431 [Penicillium taxi]